MNDLLIDLLVLNFKNYVINQSFFWYISKYISKISFKFVLKFSLRFATIKNKCFWKDTSDTVIIKLLRLMPFMFNFASRK